METIEIKKGERNQTLLMIAIGLLILLMTVMITFLVRNKDLIETDPIHYGMKENRMISCSCVNDIGTVYEINETSVIVRNPIVSPKINMTFE